MRYRIDLGVDGEAVSGERIGMEEHGKVGSVAGSDDFTDELCGRHGHLACAARLEVGLDADAAGARDPCDRCGWGVLCGQI